MIDILFNFQNIIFNFLLVDPSAFVSLDILALLLHTLGPFVYREQVVGKDILGGHLFVENYPSSEF